jgi:hypothetical protein
LFATTGEGLRQGRHRALRQFRLPHCSSTHSWTKGGKLAIAVKT